MNPKRITVLYHLIDGNSWLGGANYFLNLKNISERFIPEMQLQPVNFSRELLYEPKWWEKKTKSLLHKLGAKYSSSFIRRRKKKFLDSFLSQGPVCSFLLFSGHFQTNGALPKIFWIPDFQVFHLPHLFKPNDIEERKKNYALGAEKADVIVLSSESARKDFNQFYPGFEKKVKILRFVADVDNDVFTQTPGYLFRKYKLPEKFIYVPNQFWVHKNHDIIIDALSILERKGLHLSVVFSGSTLDPRNPDHFQNLLAKIKEKGLEERISILGIIDKEDVIQLIRQSCCVVNASRFEGWSTTVEEVKSIGKRIILSGIDVHREQNPPGGKYFDPDDAETLAKLMWETWLESAPGPDLQMELNSRNALQGRLREFAEIFHSIVQAVVAQS